MAVYLPSAAEFARENTLVNDARWQDERSPFVWLIENLRRANTDEQYRDLFRELLGRLRLRQDRVESVRGPRTAARDSQRTLAQQQPKDLDALRRVQETLLELEREEYLHQGIRELLLDYGDALAWRRLKYDRAAIAVLAQGTVVGWLSDGPGWQAELRALEEVWQEGALAILNDATTCLRHGDITCFFPDRIELREVKAGKPAAATSPQMRRLSSVVDFINVGHAAIDGNRRSLVRSGHAYRTHLAKLADLLVSAWNDGQCELRVSHAQFVVCRSLTQPGGAHEYTDEAVRRATGWADSDVVLSTGTTYRRMRDRHKRFSYVSPLTLLPVPVELLINVLFGALDFTTWVNVSSVARALVLRGFDEAVPIAPPDSGDAFLRVGLRRERDLLELQVAPHLREAMALELMTTQSLLDHIHAGFRYVAQEAEVRQEQPLIVASSETDTWEPAVLPT